ncbi:hypothetical protein [Streptomyces sp. NRRL S-350]|uniref:hypothetical protein n=1 Tax=Streptomyces sp. NRRL S-350 TaxID=1463902 RepID=UPI00068DAD44|nr:hypothetical protein [Streptomyces sp. NRRL S-350]
MNPDHIPALAAALRELGAIPDQHELTDGTLGEIAEKLDRCRGLVAVVRGAARTNSCARHPAGPVDPTAPSNCLLCGAAARRPAPPTPEGVTTEMVLALVDEHGEQAAAERYGARALARALANRTRHPSVRPAGEDTGPPREAV